MVRQELMYVEKMGIFRVDKRDRHNSGIDEVNCIRCILIPNPDLIYMNRCFQNPSFTSALFQSQSPPSQSRKRNGCTDNGRDDNGDPVCDIDTAHTIITWGKPFP